MGDEPKQLVKKRDKKHKSKKGDKKKDKKHKSKRKHKQIDDDGDDLDGVNDTP